MYEGIKVYIKYKNGKTACICCRNNKMCPSIECERDIVLRDQMRGWQEVMKNKENRY